MVTPNKASTVKQILDLFSWKKIFQLTCFLLIIGILVGLHQNRNTVYGWVFKQPFAEIPRNIKLSAESLKEIDTAVIKSDLIIGLQITVVNFNKNTRTIVYSSIDDETLKKAYKVFLDKNIGEVPLFNADAENNVRMSRLINGEFMCTPFKETIAYRLAPEAADSVEYVCANGIPPYYGKFTGIVSLYLKKKPTPAEMDQLRTVSRDMSLSIFERDFK